jgi:hypothetical protein
MTLIVPPDYHAGKWRHSTRSSSAVVRSGHDSTKTFEYPVRLDWENNPYMEHWNEVCAWTIEHFGLPGHRYRTEINKDYMIWYFTESEDQLIMTLAWGNDNGTDI